MKQLILGGARSGKSRLAESLAANSGCQVIYIATATAGDEEMAARIARHRRSRPSHWKTVEAPLELAAAIERHMATSHCVLVDCLTLWLSNWLLRDAGEAFAREKRRLYDGLERWPGHLILVSNETGSGVVPMGELSRRFVDEAGWLHQGLAARCDRVIFTIAGLPQVLKGAPL